MDNRPLVGADVETYLARIGLGDLPDDGVRTLAAVHRAHATTIPFENLDILMGRSISIDLSDVFDKLVTARRGGYCFEHNTLLAGVLDQLGFSVTRLAARVLMGAPRESSRSRTHMLLAVDIDGDRWVADVGFGGAGLLEPVRLADAEVSRQGSWVFRIQRHGPGWVLQLDQPGGWLDLYTFTEEPQQVADFEVANYYTSTHPSSFFTQMVTVQLPGPEIQLVLRDTQLAEHTPGSVLTATTVEGDDQLLDVLADRFGLVFPPGTVFRPRTA